MHPPIPLGLDALLEHMWQVGSTDLLLSVGTPPYVRVDGAMRTVPGARPLTEDDVLALLPIPDPAGLRREHDFSFSWGGRARVRGNAFVQQGTRALSLRVVPTAIPSFEELRLPDAVRPWVELPQGLVLVTGPTGSGAWRARP